MVAAGPEGSRLENLVCQAMHDQRQLDLPAH
jgi:hypothetical protein